MYRTGDCFIKDKNQTQTLTVYRSNLQVSEYKTPEGLVYVSLLHCIPEKNVRNINSL